jgi:four helix bundle protein
MGDLINHRKLVAWQEAIKLVELVYRETASFPREEMFGLKTQMRRSSVSISSNIAEGAGRNSTGELIQFLGIASGSRAELDTHLEIAVRLGLIRDNSEALSQLNRVGRLLVGLRKSLKQRSLNGQT